MHLPMACRPMQDHIVNMHFHVNMVKGNQSVALHDFEGNSAVLLAAGGGRLLFACGPVQDEHVT